MLLSKIPQASDPTLTILLLRMAGQDVKRVLHSCVVQDFSITLEKKRVSWLDTQISSKKLGFPLTDQSTSTPLPILSSTPEKGGRQSTPPFLPPTPASLPLTPPAPRDESL